MSSFCQLGQTDVFAAANWLLHHHTYFSQAVDLQLMHILLIILKVFTQKFIILRLTFHY